MNTHAILVACSLLGQANATDAPATNKYGTGERYGAAAEPKYGTQPKTTAEPRYGDGPAAAKSPASSFGDRFLQDQEAERKQFGTDNAEVSATAGDEGFAPIPRGNRPAAVQAESVDPATRRAAQTPLTSDPANRATTPGIRNNTAPRNATDVNPKSATEIAPNALRTPRTAAPITPAPKSSVSGAQSQDVNVQDPAATDVNTSDARTFERSPGVRAWENNATQAQPVESQDTATTRDPAAVTGLSATDRQRTQADTDAIGSVASAFAAPSTTLVKGTPITLTDAIGRRSDRESRLRIAHGYWRLATATAAFNLAHEEAQRALRPAQLRVASSEIDRQLLESNANSAVARLHEAQTAAVSAQHDLAEAIGSAVGDSLPLATDAPYLGVYATKFDELFSDRAAPVQIRAIHTTLPTLRKAVVSRATAVQHAAVALDRAEQAFAQGQVSVDAYLAAFRQLSQERQAFLAVARGYNDDIADYAINVARDGTGPVELTSMLIRVRKDTTSPDATRRAAQPPAARAAEIVRPDVITDRSTPATRGGAVPAGDGFRSKSVRTIP
jgi:hypothetical protein